MKKRCCTCKQTKPLSSFGKNRSRRDGLQVACKSCVRDYGQKPEVKAKKSEYNKRYRQANRETLDEYQRQYKKTEHGKAARKRYEISPRGRARQKARRERSKKRIRATNALNKAILNGSFPHISIKVCTHCGKPAQEYHHPNGYDKPHWFDVIPLCLPCHRKQH